MDRYAIVIGQNQDLRDGPVPPTDDRGIARATEIVGTFRSEQIAREWAEAHIDDKAEWHVVPYTFRREAERDTQ